MDIHCLGDSAHVLDMAVRIDPARPFKVYFSEWMAHAGFNQERTAERMHCSPGTVSKLKNNGKPWSQKWLLEAADAFDIDVDQLFRDPKRPTQEDLLRGVTDKKRAEIIDVIKVMTGT